MINNIYTLKEKDPPNFLSLFSEKLGYMDDGDLCFDLEEGDCEFTLIFENKSELNETDKKLLSSLLENIIELDLYVANRMRPHKDYEFELSYIEIRSEVSFSYCGVNVNSTWDFSFIATVNENQYEFHPKYNK